MNFDFKKFITNKLNITLIVLITVSIILAALSAVGAIFTILSMLSFAATLFFSAYLLIRRKIVKDRTRVSDFMDDDEKLKKKTQTFLEKESRANSTLTISAFIVFGILLVYMAIKMM